MRVCPWRWWHLAKVEAGPQLGNCGAKLWATRVVLGKVGGGHVGLPLITDSPYSWPSMSMDFTSMGFASANSFN